MKTHQIEVRGRIAGAASTAPVADTEIRVGVRRAREMLGTATTASDQAGRCAVTLAWTGPAVGELALDARAVDHAVGWWPQCLPPGASAKPLYAIHAGDERGVDLELAPGFSVDILVADPAGQSPPGVVDLLPVSPHRGAPTCRAFPLLRRKPDGARRWHLHAVRHVARPVAGPLLLGAGRYQGYGLCQPLLATDSLTVAEAPPAAGAAAP